MNNTEGGPNLNIKVGHAALSKADDAGASVMRSIDALQSRALGITCVHSENGRLVVTIAAAFSARSAMTWNRNSAPTSASGT